MIVVGRVGEVVGAQAGVDETVGRFWAVIGWREGSEGEPKGVVLRAPTSVPGRVLGVAARRRRA